MNRCCPSLTCRCVRTVCVSTWVAWYALLAVAPPKIRHEHPIAETAQPVAQHVHHDHSHQGHHHHHAGPSNSPSTLNPPLRHWHVWLAGIEWTIPADENRSNGPEDESTPLIVTAVLGDFTPTLRDAGDVAPLGMISIPQEPCPALLPPPLLWRDHWRTGPPVCDTARGLRSGVLQV